MVRIAYRTSSGIYGPKDATFPKVIRDAEMQLKRCRLREHSLRKCISVLLVVVAFCMCGLIVGLVSTCQDEDDQEKVDESSDLKPVINDAIQPTRKSSIDKIETSNDDNAYATDGTPPASDVLTSAIVESSHVTTGETDNTSYRDAETAHSAFKTLAYTSDQTHETESSLEETTTQEYNLPFADSTSYSYSDYSISKSLSNVPESVPLSVSPQSKFSFLSPAGEDLESSTTVQSHPSEQSEIDLPDSSILPTNVNKSRQSSSVEAIATLTESEPIVKVSFVTHHPVCCG